MSAVVRSGPQPARSPREVDAWSAGTLAAGFLLLYLPTYWGLSQTLWRSDEQGHGPIILALGLWLLYRASGELLEMAPRPAHAAGWGLLGLSLLLYALGRSQAVLMFEVGSQIGVLASLLLLFRGWRALRRVWFPLFFLLFMVPLPEALVAAVTAPLKSAVSATASSLLYQLGYPVGRSGVILTVGPFQLLVADACAGLNSMFTLEALGMLYMSLMKYTSKARNVSLALLLVPIAFVSNVVRVMVLVLVTYHFGDAAGQGFVHGFAGMVLFVVALMLMLVADRALGAIFDSRRAA
nr:exosortase B [Rubrivivax gelatinosus]